MLLSKELKKIGIECKCVNEKEFSSLGLASYNDKQNVCTFITSGKYADSLSSGVSMIITNEVIYEELKGCNKLANSYGVCIVDNPRIVYFKLHCALCDDDKYRRAEFNTRVSSSAYVNKLACIAEKNVIIGDNVIIEEFASIKENTIIGNNSVIRSGSVIGGTGFEIKNSDGRLWTVKHVGGVIIGNNVEIQQCSSVDKAIYPWDDTILSDYVKINSQVQVAHGVKVNTNTEIASNTGIQGRVQIGKNVWIGPGCVIRNGIRIGDNARINMGSVVTLDVENGEELSGNFAIPHLKFIEEMKLKK